MLNAIIRYNTPSRVGILMRPLNGGDIDEGTSISEEDVRQM